MAYARYAVCGVEITALSHTEAVRAVVEGALSGSPFEVHLCNAYTLSLVDRDGQLRAALASAHLNLPDGTPVAWLGRGHGAVSPVRGPDLVRGVVRAGVSAKLTHFFYGGTGQVAAEMAAKLVEYAPGLRVAGVETPPYHDLEAAELSALADRIRVSGARVVWVGLGTPRQDYFVAHLAKLLDVAIVPVGAAFDFISGRVQEAPALLHGTGLEWLYRVSREPRRLWQRYLIGNSRFLVCALRHRRQGSPE